MAKGKVCTRLIDTGIFRTYEKHCVLDDGTDIPLERRPFRPLPLVRKGETLPHIEGEIQAALDDDSDFKGEAIDAEKMLQKLKIAMAEGDVGNILYWGYFLGRTMERHDVRKQESHARRGKKTLASAKLGHAMVHGTADERQTESLAMKERLDEEIESGEPLMTATETSR
jgi:hypothetical protein